VLIKASVLLELNRFYLTQCIVKAGEEKKSENNGGRESIFQIINLFRIIEKIKSKEKCLFSVYFAKKKKYRKIQISIGPKHSFL